MKRIPLHDRAGVVVAYSLVDDDTFAEVGHLRWCLHSKGYAVRAGGSLFLHRHVLGLERGDARQADHINGDRLNNQRANLRILTAPQQRQNERGRRGVSRHRGVFREKGKWRAQVCIDGRRFGLGTWDTEAEAAAAASGARRVLMPYAVEDGQIKQEAG